MVCKRRGRAGGRAGGGGCPGGPPPWPAGRGGGARDPAPPRCGGLGGRCPARGAVWSAVAAVALLAEGCGGQVTVSVGAITGETSQCCLVVNFGNDNSSPELSECRQVCRAFVPYKSLQSCKMNETCSNLVRDFDGTMALASARLSQSRVCSTDDRVCYTGVACAGGECKAPPATMSVSCELAIRRGVCAYHFPICISDQVTISYQVCAEACDQIYAYCNVSLDEVTSHNLCADRNFGCTSGAARLETSLLSTAAAVLLLPLALTAAASVLCGDPGA